MKSVLIVGSAPDALRIQSVDCSQITNTIAINNAWRLRKDWDYIIFPEDFPKPNQPQGFDSNKLISAKQYVPEQNSFGGFIYAGGTMSFTAGYWALGALKPDVIAYLGCDMIYPNQKEGQTHFYGTGHADPLRKDVTLQSLEAKSARFLAFAKSNHCKVFNLSEQPKSRLLFPKIPITTFLDQDLLAKTIHQKHTKINTKSMEQALAKEKALSYMAPSGRYWEIEKDLDPSQLRSIDNLWLQTLSHA
jgi:hypothetical protein